MVLEVDVPNMKDNPVRSMKWSLMSERPNAGSIRWYLVKKLICYLLVTTFYLSLFEYFALP
jgi:hypothetical protein